MAKTYSLITRKGKHHEITKPVAKAFVEVINIARKLRAEKYILMAELNALKRKYGED